ncbi:MAG: D-hexose-6-phosphate mutarotase [Lautropia sp.]|nr:D-hexose-6-phosphate mutarotase [Lautropia sp.]
MISIAGQKAFRLRNTVGDTLIVLQHGAQILSWETADGVERLYCTPYLPQEPRPVRGGVPVIFPQFNRRGPDVTMPRHGFARLLPWELVGMPQAGGAVRRPETACRTNTRMASDQPDLVLSLTDGPLTAQYPMQGFCLQLQIRLQPRQLAMQLVLSNSGPVPLTFTAALHTYLALLDLSGTTLKGLQGSTRINTLIQPEQEQVADSDSLVLKESIDDIYLGVTRPLLMCSGADRLRITLTGGFRDMVIWNPGADGAAAFTDMPNDDWRHMLCVEAACIGLPAMVPVGEKWTAGQHLQVL